MDIVNVLVNSDQSTGLTMIMSGSTAEGFNMKTSDYDMMYVLDKVVVMQSYHPSPDRSATVSVLTYETDCTSPGFAMIKYTYPNEINEFNLIFFDVLIRNSAGSFLSSKLFPEVFLEILPSAKIHGPCISGEQLECDLDCAICLKCPFWPHEASSFVIRSLRTGWPSEQVLYDICDDGFLFVPISSKQTQCRETIDMEWRMSFSLAEKKLVYSMNHCQFLCYGLLKLFLNEVLKPMEHINGLLCSYFLKTAVFWEISEDTSDWTVQNFLFKFWRTFCRLLKWVYNGYCPNFFIPSNNMFAGKIQGRNQDALMDALRSLHGEGFQLLLRCPSLQKDFTMILRQPTLAGAMAISEDLYVPQWQIEFEKITCVLTALFDSQTNITESFQAWSYIANISPASGLMESALKFHAASLLQNIGEDILAKIVQSDNLSNKIVLKFLCIAISIIKRNDTTLCANEIVIAMWLYTLGRYRLSINVLKKVKTKLQDSQFMYEWAKTEADYRRLHVHCHERSYESFVKSSIVGRSMLSERDLVDELKLELISLLKFGKLNFINIPPMVFVSFLLVMSYHRLGDTDRRNDVLRDLQALVCYDDGHHIFCKHRAISWEILGICQQICGDYHSAYQSYVNVLNDEHLKYNDFRFAAITRIQSLFH